MCIVMNKKQLSRCILMLLSCALICLLLGCKSDNSNKLDDEGSLENFYKADSSYLGINLSAVKDYSSEYPFKDIFKMARVWRTESTHQDYVSFITDDNGWIMDLNGNDHAVAFLANQYLPIGDYIMTYDGVGDISFIGPNVEITNISEGEVEFTITKYGTSSSTNNRVKITSIDKVNYIKNIQIIEKQYMNTMDDIFNPVFIQNISIFHDLRFMDWMDTNNSEVSEWSDRPKVSDHCWSIKGIPVEIMVELCNKIKANPWFCMPHSATDEYVIEFSKYVSNNLDDKLIVYVENSNETWNGIFSAQSYNLKMGIEHPNIDDSEANWKIAAHYYAQRSVEMFKIWEENFGRNNLIKILSSQSSNYGVGTTIMKYELEDGSLAAEYANALAIAPYIGNNILKTEQDEIFSCLDEQLKNDLIADLQSNKDNAEMYNLELICYEAGQHLVDSSSDDKTIAFIAANKSLLMADVYNEYLDVWKDTVGGKMFLFSSTTVYDKYGSWGLLEYQNQIHSESIKYSTVNTWIEHNKKS